MNHRKTVFSAIILVAACWPASVLAATPAATCNSLIAQESADKNYYSLTATATADSGATITGYSFDFGDKQSYTYNFASKATGDRSHATVQHTYKHAGNYAPKVTVLTSVKGQTTKTTSPACTTTVINGQPTPDPSDLPNTGITSAVVLFIASTAGGTLLYLLGLRTKLARNPLK